MNRKIILLVMLFLMLFLMSAFSSGALAADERVSVTIEPASCYYGDEVTITISAPGASMMQLYYNGENDKPIEGDSLTETWQVWEDIELYAIAKFEDGWSEPSAAAALDLLPAAELETPILTVPETVETGYDVPVSWTPVENIDMYVLKLFAVEKDALTYLSSVWYSPDVTDSMFPSLAPGSYRVELEVWGTNGEGSEAYADFTVTGEPLAAPTVYVNSTDLLINGDLDIYVNAPEAELIHLLWDGYIDSFYSPDGDTTAFYFTASTPGWHKITASVQIDGVWTAYSDPVYVNVTSYGTLDTPVLTMPEAVTAGEDFSVSWTEVEHADEFVLQVYRITDNDSTWLMNEWYYGEMSAAVYPGSNLQPGTYAMQLHAMASGWTSTYSDFTAFTVLEGDADFTYKLDDGCAVITGYVGTASEVSIPSEIDGYPVTVIGYSAFRGRTVTTVELPDTITAIEWIAFYDCVSLTSIEIGFDVAVDSSAFDGCSNLTIYGYSGSSAEIAANTLGIPFVALGQLAAGPTVTVNKTSVGLSEEVTFTISAPGAEEISVKQSSYYDEHFIVPTGDTTTYSCCFYELGEHDVQFRARIDGVWTAYSEPISINVTALGKLSAPVPSLPDSITAGEDFVVSWDRVEHAESYIFALVLQNMHLRVFEGDASSTSFTFPGCHLQAGCTYQLYASAHADGYVAGYQTYTFTATEGSIQFTCNPVSTDSAYISGYAASAVDVAVPESINEYTVTGIASYAFAGRNISSITLPETLMYIEYHAFYACALSEITLPDNIIYVHEEAFANCPATLYCTAGSTTATALDDAGIAYTPVDVVFPKTLPSALLCIEAEAFAGLPFKTIRIPDGCQTIGSRAFADCTHLYAAFIPASVTSIAADAFTGCANVVIHGTASSTAEVFSAEQGLQFIAH